ncbi:MAG TPA: GNAT family N-acetyltransferase [Deltaproteobacteria bacterium]|nr:GNAT family N-acetyltransferase [Deltaproteobacteria bacterium]
MSRPDTGPEWTLRRARATEAQILTELAHAAKRHWGYPETWMQLWRAELTFTKGYLRNHEVFVGETCGQVVGVVTLAGAPERIMIDHFWVHPGWIGHGLGRALFDHACTAAARLGSRTLRVIADPHAEAFYQHMGLARTGVLPSLIPGRELPVLEMDLSPVGKLACANRPNPDD